MQPLHNTPPIAPGVTARAMRIVEQALAANGVTRARDLPEEARVRLHQRLARLFDEDRAERWARAMDRNPVRRMLCRFSDGLARLRYTLWA